MTLETFSSEWVRKNAQCDAGRDWGLAFTADGPKTVEAALRGIERADFLLWFLAYTEKIDAEDLTGILWRAATEWIEDASAKELLRQLASPLTLDQARRVGVLATSEASLAFLGEDDFAKGHALTAVAFMARYHAWLLSEEDNEDLALKSAQCVVNNLIAERTGGLRFDTEAAKQLHRALCAQIVTLTGGCK